ncbi:MAG: YwaF family protein [Oscillospiraceae bacterium]|nr:YwaF family protein [Oscillospiraceae bacterium]
MQNFLHTTETVPEGLGFSHFDSLHLIWLVAGVLICVLNALWYRSLSEKGKDRWKKIVASLIVLDEIFKVVMLVIGNRYKVSYLPLHLCSINIFIIAVHAWKPSRILGGFLYTVCIPGAIAALLFPTWTSLPLGNFMHLHSFTVHILLVMYPVVLTASGELAPSVKQLHKYLLLLIAMALPIWLINILLDTNFMFLMEADEGNPLYLFEQLWGSHLLGFPVIIAGVLVVMYVPLVIYRLKKGKEI